ncbi:MAG: 5-methylthioadenosine phosphorylase [Solirubrobacteraceae bacterium]|nr:5-methylthioadenosine phosphorylase [Solirubrobacteraceae bacterium]
MAIGVITGSGTYALPDFAAAEPAPIETPWGAALVTRGRFAGTDVLHVSRHGEGHARLSNHVTFRANVWALRELGATSVISCTACGAVDPTVELGSLVVFDDLHFVANRLPDGSLCTFFAEAGDRQRGHWIYDSPFSAEVRAAIVAGARQAAHPVRDGGCYGHVDGPRFNTRAEIRGLEACGVTAVSQTGGPETVLCGELELPFALVGFATDYANGVKPGDPTPVQELIRLMGESSHVFAQTLGAALPSLTATRPSPAGLVYRFESP